MQPRDMHVIEAERGGETTRFVLGCEEECREVVAALRTRNFRIKSESYEPEPARADSERLRATRILGEIFGH